MIEGLPERLKSLRTKYRMSQKTVAERLDISPSIVAGYESGYRTPSTEVLLALSYLYHCSTDYLLGKQSDENSVKIDLRGFSDAEAEAITHLIDTFSKH